MPPRAYTGENDQKYQKLFKMYKRAHPDKLGMDVSDEVIRLWKETLQKGKDDAVYTEYMARQDRKIERNAKYNIKASVQLSLKEHKRICKKAKKHFGRG